MIITLAGGGYPATLTARKRRYSSTAVGFPIRYDLSAHSQGISEGFPSWERARCAHTYVCPHVKCDIQPYELPSSDLLSTLVHVATAYSTPSAVLIFCSFAASLLVGLTLRIPNELAVNSLPYPPLLSEFCSWLARGSLGIHLETCTILDTPVLYTFRTRSEFIHSCSDFIRILPTNQITNFLDRTL